MAEIILSPVLELLFEKLASKAESTVKDYQLKKKKLKELPETIKWWRERLGEMEEVLISAEQQQFRRDKVKTKWLKDLQDWAYDVEDILDEFATDLRLKELESQSRERGDSLPTCTCAPFIKVASFLTCNSGASDSSYETFLTRIDAISNRLEGIQNRARQVKDLTPSQSPSMKESHTRPAETSGLPSQDVFGRDDEKHRIIHRLMKDEPTDGKYVVIPVVGKGGIGKTTFAQSVYNDEQVKAHFHFKAWVCLSNDVFDVQQITKDIINSANIHEASNNLNTLHGAQETLQKKLSGQRFLIILDNVWSDNYNLWDQLQAPFQVGSKGSRVIVTTRIEKVAKTMRTTPGAQSQVVNLKELSDNACWSICKQHALISDDPFETRNRVTELSKGLPLAAKALGGLLRQSDKHNWSTILRSTIWSEETTVLPALALSFYHLPHHLKRVFAYCSIFPKDHRMYEEDIVLMWMAEGFLPESKEESMESKGHGYFADLVSRSLIEPSSSGKGCFIMHDLIHDLAKLVAGDICCRIEIDAPTSRTRFFSFTHNTSFGLVENIVGDVNKQLRTFAFWGYGLERYDFSFKRFQCMRVLCIGDAGISELSSNIGDLKHLRLVDLSFNPLEELPESMSKLINLQSLVLKWCSDLTKVLINMEHFLELRHLDIEGSGLLEMPSGFEKLTNLRTSRRFIINVESGKRIRELEKLKYLSGSLDIIGLENVMNSEDAARARMNEKEHLEILRMFWETSAAAGITNKRLDELHGTCNQRVQPSGEREVLNQLQPPKSIKELALKGYKGIEFPDWLGSPSFNKMVVLRLKDCSECERLPPLGKLPALEELVVDSMDGIKSIGLEFYGVGCSNPFPVLKIFKIQHMEHLKNWLPPSSIDSNRGFLCLENLSIRSCPILEGDTPSFLPSLKTLHIEECEKLKVKLGSCPLLQNLILSSCRELFSIEPVICCSRSLQLTCISSFSGFEGFWVPEVETLSIVRPTHRSIRTHDDASKYGDIYIQGCPKPLSWRPDVYGELTKLNDVTLANCDEWNVFLETKFPSTVRRLSIDNDNSIKHMSRFTSNQSTCLLEQLRIEDSSLTSISNLPLTLQVLEIINSQIQQPPKEWKLHLLTSLRKLKIIGSDESKPTFSVIPDPDLPLPSSLVEVTIYGATNLKLFSCSTLPYLAKLEINKCPLMTREGVHVPKDFKFQSEGGLCRLLLNDSAYQLY